MKKFFLLLILLDLLTSKNVNASFEVNLIGYPQQIVKGEEFKVIFNIITDTISSDSYYVKGRIGSSSSSLSKGLTLNPESGVWLSDTSSWSSFPSIKFDNNLIATGSILLKTEYINETGSNFLAVRINGGGKNYDSQIVNLLTSDATSPTSPPTPTSSFTPSPIPTVIPVTYENIFISEIMANPGSGQNEWVELYNANDFSVSLANWYIDDIENEGSTPKIFNLEIPQKGFRVFNLSSSIFNNDGDTVRLLDFSKNLKDDFEFSLTSQGKTFGRLSFNSSDVCLEEPSYESANNSCINNVSTPTASPVNQTQISPAGSTPTKIMLIKKPAINKSALKKSDVKTAGSNPEILGVSTKISNFFYLSKLLSLISLSYSLLTIAAILIKMKNIYGKVEKLLSSLIYSGGA